MNTKTLSILGLLAVVGIAGAYFATRSGLSTASDAPAAAGSGTLLFPDLAAKADSVASIVVKRAATEVTIRKDGDTWKVSDKANYPAKPEAVRSLLVGLSQLKLDEAKTQRKDQYAKLGVDDPVAPPPDSADKAVPQSSLVTLKDSTGKELGAIILGNPKYGGQGVVGNGTMGVYIRKPGDAQTWLATGQVELPRESVQWLDTTFADIKRDRIKSVIVVQPPTAGGTTLTVSREKQADPFTITDIPAGRELKDPGAGESVASALTGLTLQDVAPASAGDPAAAGPETKPGPVVTLRTFDGLIVTATSITKDAKAWWRLIASADDAILATLPPAAAAANPTTPDGSTPPTPPPTPPATATPPPAPPVGTAESIRKEVADLNAKWAPYAFAPADWKVRTINTPLADLLKEPAAAPVNGQTPPAPSGFNPPSLPPGLNPNP